MIKLLLSLTILVSCVAPLLAQEATSFAASDWPWWRGPTRNGVASPQQNPPTKWSDSENILWKTRVPGKGHGSAILLGDSLYLAVADETADSQAILCIDRTTGDVNWESAVHSSGLKQKKKGNKKATMASTTPATDGERIYVNFLNAGAVVTSALNLKGDVLWQTKISDYTVHQGYGSSPAIWGNVVIVSADNKGGGAIAGLDRETGKILWRHSRPKKPNYASPVVLMVNDQHQLIFTGCDLVSSYNPLTGKKLWETKGSTTECVTSTVTDGELIYTSGGYPKNHVSAVKADGSGKVVWENTSRVYVPSMIVQGDYLYAVMDAGIAICWKAATGEEVWKGRLKGTFTSSPILVDDRIYATNEAGTTFVFSTDPKAFRMISTNPLKAAVFSTPVIADSKIYLRVATTENGKRQEWVYCIGQKN